MPFATPLALLGLLFVPLVVAMYLLKLRRDETVVPSTLLWRKAIQDLHASGSTVCLATHDPRYIALAKRHIKLFDGRVVES